MPILPSFFRFHSVFIPLPTAIFEPRAMGSPYGEKWAPPPFLAPIHPSIFVNKLFGVSAIASGHMRVGEVARMPKVKKKKRGEMGEQWTSGSVCLSATFHFSFFFEVLPIFGLFQGWDGKTPWMDVGYCRELRAGQQPNICDQFFTIDKR